MSRSEAIRHEDVNQHTVLIRETNVPFQQPSSPPHLSSPTQHESSDPPDYQRDSPLPTSSPPIYMDNEIDQWRGLSPMSGPALPEDNPNAIYDDYAGAWGSQMPRIDDHEPDDYSDHEDIADEAGVLNEEDSNILSQDDDAFEGLEEPEENAEYFGPAEESEDLTQQEDGRGSDPEDW